VDLSGDYVSGNSSQVVTPEPADFPFISYHYLDRQFIRSTKTWIMTNGHLVGVCTFSVLYKLASELQRSG
jgi:hypothetical protein